MKDDTKEMRNADREYATDTAQSACNGLLDAAIELLVVATLRGDNDLPHPVHDEKKWTARMQEAWDNLFTVVNSIAPESVYEGVSMNRKYEPRNVV